MKLNLSVFLVWTLVLMISCTPSQEKKGGGTSTAPVVGVEMLLDANIQVPIVSAPTNNNVFSADTTEVTLSWNTIEASGYYLRVQNLTDPNARVVAGTSLYLYLDKYNQTSYKLPVKSGQKYKFWIHAAGKNNSNNWSNPATVLFEVAAVTNTSSTTSAPEKKNSQIAAPVIVAPANSSQVEATSSVVKVSWNAVDGAIGYLVRAVKIGGSGTVVYNDNVTSLSYDVPVAAGNQYKFWVHAKRKDFSYTIADSFSVESATIFTVKASAVVSVPVESGSMGPPVVVSPKNGDVVESAGKVTVSWNAVTGAATYDFCSSIQGDSSSKKCLSVSGVNSYSIDVSVGKKYDFWITAKDAKNNLSDTTVISFMTKLAAGTCEGGFVNGQTQQREMFKEATVTGGASCVSQTQSRTCQNGSWSAWSGTYSVPSCSVAMYDYCASGKASKISQYGITWTFDREYECGQFVNGDYWVVGSVKIVDIDPKTSPVDNGGVITNGSMINPIPGQTQGFYRNGSPTSSENRPAYDSSKNISLRLPVVVQADSSVYSTMNNPLTWGSCDLDANGKPIMNGPNGIYGCYKSNQEGTWFKETAVLTVLGAKPPAGSFRPAYAGNQKKLWNVSQLNFGVFKSLAIPKLANAPSMTWLEEATKRPLIEMDFGYLNSNFKASWSADKGDGSYPRRTYGREVAHISGGAGLMLNTNLSNAAKMRLLIYMVQWGIDTYGLMQNGMQYWGSGGHQNGRTIPLYIAAKTLGEVDMMAKLRPGAAIFQEFVTHFFVDQKMVDIVKPNHNPPYKPYTSDMIGMPEWAGVDKYDPNNSSAWDELSGYYSSGYRYVVGGSNGSTIATYLIMGGRSEINQEAFFRYYIEKYYPAQKPTNDMPYSNAGNGINPFVRDMWDTYLDSKGNLK